MERDRLERLPQRLRDSPYTSGVSDPMADLSQELLEEARRFYLEFYAHTATETGLAEWERLTGLTPVPGSSLKDRRDAVIAQLCAGGTANAALIESMARALTGYEAKVTEHFSAYTFSLRFYGTQIGFVNIDTQKLRDAVELIKPAHLQFVIESITWGDLEGAGLTWAQVEEQFKTWGGIDGKIFCHIEET